MKITKKAPANVTSAKKIEGKRNYGGAYDVDPYQYFSRDDITEFGDGVAFKLSNIYDMQFRMVDVYIVDYSRIVVELANDDDTLEVTGQADIDMRKIRKPADIHKFADAVIKDIQHDHEIEDFVESVESCSSVTASIDDWSDPEDLSPYGFVATKSVRDSDGFITDYTMYYDPETGTYFTMFGDMDITEPDPAYADWECDTLDEAREWFEHFNGFEDDEDDEYDIELSTDISCANNSNTIKAATNWTEAYEDFQNVVEKYFPDEEAIEHEVDALYRINQDDPGYQEAYKRWCETFTDEDKEDAGLSSTGVYCSNSTYRQGDQRTFNSSDDEFYLLEDLAQALKKKSPNKHDYFVEDCYLDFGSGWMWTTVVDGSTSSGVQVLNPRQWLNLINQVQTPEEIADEILNGEYCQDKKNIKSSKKVQSSVEGSEEFEEYEDDIKEIDQEFTSENTSINSTKLPAVFKMVSFAPGTINIDYGGGRFDNVADYLTQYDVINLVYDPYNRTPEHNKEVIKTVRKAGGADTATCSNVLNVIKEPEVRKNVLENIKKLVKSGGTVYITVYEGNGSGEGSPTKSGYQTNRKTADYLDEIKEVFPNATRKGKLIVAKNSSGVASSERVELGRSSSQLQDTKIYQYLEECGGYTDYNQKIEDLCEEFGLTLDDAETYVANYASGQYSDVQSAQKIEADYLDPPEYTEPDDVSLWDETIELDVDAYITVDDRGSWVYCDSEGNENEPDGYSFCRSDEKDGEWHSEEYSNIFIGDPTSICEDFDSLIEANIPAEPGFYHITCTADLVYEISGVESEIIDEWFDEDHGYDYDEEIYTDNAEADFSLEKSTVRDFNFDKID